MRLLIAFDSFKDALDAISACRAVERGFRQGMPGAVTRIFPLSDGGDGLAAVLQHHLGLQAVTCAARDPLGRPSTATYLMDNGRAFIEMARAAGLERLPAAERNPLFTTTLGVGDMIRDAAARGAGHILLGIGGSATNDLGTGMAEALGWRFEDATGNNLHPNGQNLARVARIVPPPADPLPGVRIEVLCDVTNPLLGEQGCARVFAPQKGADDAGTDQLEQGARHFTGIAQAPAPLVEMPGAGAAGGLGFGAVFFLRAALRRGIDAVMDLTGFDAQAAWADLIITGEGRFDSQTASGKVIAGIAARAGGTPVVALCGAVEASPEAVAALGLVAAWPIGQRPGTLEEALRHTAGNLEKTACNLGRLWALSHRQ